jgi:hypothetical protein
MEKIKNEERRMSMFMQIRRNLPKNQIILYVFLIIKIIPVVVITHDWNLNYGSGISSFLNIFTLSDSLYKIKDKKFTETLIILYAIFSILPLLIFFLNYLDLKKYSKLFLKNKKSIAIGSSLIFFFQFFLTNYFFSLVIENYFCQGIRDPTKTYLITGYPDLKDTTCRDPFNYFIMALQTILLLYTIIISYFISLFLFEPFFFSDKIIVSELNSTNFRWAFFSLFQAIVQMEYHIPFKIMVFIKIFTRASFCYFYLKNIIHLNKSFYTKKNVLYWKNFILSACASSCIIEYCFLWDYNNNLIILNSDLTIVVMKILIELCMAFIIMKFIEIKELECLSDLTTTCNKTSNHRYEYFSKYFYFLNSFEDHNNLQNLIKMVRNFFDLFYEHKTQNKCKKPLNETETIPFVGCFCEKYEIEDIYVYSNDFFEKLRIQKENKIKHESKFFKKTFPIYFEFLENFIQSNIEKYKGVNDLSYAQFLLIYINFLVIFDKNFNKSLFLLEDLTKTMFYKKYFIARIQVNILRSKVTEEFVKYQMGETDNKIHKKKKASFKDSFKNYKRFLKYLHLDNYLQITIQSYYNLLIRFHDHEISFDDFYHHLKEFNINLESVEKILKYSFKSSEPCSNKFMCSKLTIFYKFFKKQINLEEVKEYFTPIYQIEEKLSQEKLNAMILESYRDKDKFKLKITYASDNLCEELKYTAEELKKKDFNELMPKTFSDAFRHHMVTQIKNGVVKINEESLCLIDKDNYAKLFNFNGIVILKNNIIKIFAKVNEVKITKTKRKHNSKTYSTQQRETCFLFVNKRGKIVSISREFEKYFYLSFKIIKKIKLNIFKDLLKIEHINTKKMIFRQTLNSIYENIADLNFNQIYESSNEEFRSLYAEILSLKNRIKFMSNIKLEIMFEERSYNKGDSEHYKEFFFVRFSHENENYMSTGSFLAPGGAYGGGSTFAPSNINFQIVNNFKQNNFNDESPHSKRPYTGGYPIRTYLNEFSLEEEKENVKRKTNKIRDLSFHLLNIIYKIKKKDISQSDENNVGTSSQNIPTKKKKDKGILGAHNNNSITNVSISSTTPLKVKNKLSKRISVQMTIMIICLVFFIISLIIVNNITNSLYTKTVKFMGLGYSVILTKNLLLEMTGRSLYMYLQTNQLQETVLDNGFSNTYSTHKKYLGMKVIDYRNYYRKMLTSLSGITDIPSISTTNKIGNQILKFKEMELNWTSTFKNKSLYNTLNYIHMDFDTITREHLKNFYLNMTDENGVSQYQPINFILTNSNKPTESDQNLVKILENMLTNIKYPLDEIMNLQSVNMLNYSSNSQVYVLCLNLSISFVLFIMFIYQTFVFFKIYNIIFAKYYINFNYLRFFSNYLAKKTLFFKDFIENTISDKYKKLNSTYLGLNEGDEEIQNIGTVNIDNAYSFLIKPLEIRLSSKLEYFREKNNSLQSNPSQFILQRHKAVLESSAEEVKRNDLISSKILPSLIGYGSEFNLNNKKEENQMISNIGLKSFLRDSNNINEFEEKKESEAENYFKKIQDNHPNENEQHLYIRNLARLHEESRKNLPQLKKLQALNNNSKIIKTNVPNNSSVINTTTQNNTTLFNQTSGGLLHNRDNDSNYKKPLQKPTTFYKHLYMFIGVAVFVFIIMLINFVLISIGFDKLKQVNNMLKLFYSKYGWLNELLLIYQVSLLKGKPITFNYQSFGYLNDTINNGFLNDYEVTYTRDIFNESLTHSDYFFNGIYSIKNSYSLFKATLSLEADLNSDQFCENYATYYKNNKNTMSAILIPKTEMLNYTYDSILAECEQVGGGFNSKGMSDSISSMVKYIIDQYNDFVKDKDKSLEKAKIRLNDRQLQTYQAQMMTVFSNIYVFFIVPISADYSSANSSTSFMQVLFLDLIIIFIVILGFVYIFFFSLNLKRFDKIISKTEETIYNTLLF